MKTLMNINELILNSLYLGWSENNTNEHEWPWPWECEIGLDQKHWHNITSKKGNLIKTTFLEHMHSALKH